MKVAWTTFCCDVFDDSLSREADYGDSAVVG